MRTFPPVLSDTTRIVLLGAIRLYQLTLSPIFGPCCRYSPSCSHYGAEAIRRFGALRGSWLAMIRVLRCNPWGGAGDDPVPQHWSTPAWLAAWPLSWLARTAPGRTLTVERKR